MAVSIFDVDIVETFAPRARERISDRIPARFAVEAPGSGPTAQ